VNTTTAPRHVEVFGLDTKGREVKLTDLEYDIKGESVQTFEIPVSNPSKPFVIIQ
jgi:hypothetical protein